MKLNKTKSLVKAGFSLVEMLVVIAVIGIMAAIAVPQIGKITDKSKDAKDKRNAQSIASIYASASAAGYDFVNPDGTGASSDVDAVAALVVAGHTIVDSSSAFNGTRFSVPGVTGTDLDRAADYLRIANEVLVYEGTDSDTTN